MAEATRIRGMFEASRFASSVVNTHIIGRVPLFSCPPPGTPLTDRLCSRPETFILRSTFLFGPLRCMFRSPISDIVRQISTCGPLSQYLQLSNLNVLCFLIVAQCRMLRAAPSGSAIFPHLLLFVSLSPHTHFPS
jgi:hypothetical protein